MTFGRCDRRALRPSGLKRSGTSKGLQRSPLVAAFRDVALTR